MIVRRSLLGTVAVAVALVLLGAGDANASGGAYHPYAQFITSNTNHPMARGLLALGGLHASQRHVNFGHHPSHGAAMQHIHRQYPVHQIRTAPPNLT